MIKHISTARLRSYSPALTMQSLIVFRWNLPYPKLKSKEKEYQYDCDIPDAETVIQSQSAVIYRGTEMELQQFVHNPWFAEICMGFFHQAVKNHYYGFNRLHYLHVTPVYKDFDRTTDEFNYCFMGFLIKHGHYDYMPGRKKVWYD